MPDLVHSLSQKLKEIQIKRYIAPLLITVILLVAEFSFGILKGYEKFIVALGSSILTELMLGRLVLGKWRNLSSAYITGISVSILVRSQLNWIYALCSMLSITSKYVIRYKGTHIWNPSNFGVVALLILASNKLAILSIQWGNNLWPMLVIWVLGFAIIWRVKRFHICATYVASFFFFSLLRSWITGDPFMAEISPITGPMYQLFVFFMITDPKTTVKSRLGQYLVAFSIGLVEFIFRLNSFIYAPFYALFVVGPTAMFIEKWWQSHDFPKLAQYVSRSKITSS
ncbi:MAG TPA: RnfABCDGE type electron transport complex subunit D [Balneolaceae bacterium]|nr:RnfABCDGE type electron transport complex subunit D [Balneolaceae bacterium]